MRISLKDAANHYTKDIATLRRWIKEGILPAEKDAKGKYWVESSAVEAVLLDRHHIPDETPEPAQANHLVEMPRQSQADLLSQALVRPLVEHVADLERQIVAYAEENARLRSEVEQLRAKGETAKIEGPKRPWWRFWC